MKSKSAFCLFFLAGLLSVTECFPIGAPAGACTNVAPNPAAMGGHGAGPQNSAVPYVLTGLPSSGNYTPGMSYTREFPLTDVLSFSVTRQPPRVCLLAHVHAAALRVLGCPLQKPALLHASRFWTRMCTYYVSAQFVDMMVQFCSRYYRSRVFAPYASSPQSCHQ